MWPGSDAAGIKLICISAQGDVSDVYLLQLPKSRRANGAQEAAELDSLGKLSSRRRKALKAEADAAALDQPAEAKADGDSNAEDGGLDEGLPRKRARKAEDPDFDKVAEHRRHARV